MYLYEETIVTFKSNWEKTSTRVHLSEQLILEMLATYYIGENDIKSVSVIPGGCANINVLVHLNDSKPNVILRVYLREKESAYREQKISSLLQGKLPVPKFYYISERVEYIFAITECLPGTTLRDFLLREKKTDISNIMFKVGEALGAISNIKFPSSGFFNRNLETTNSLTREGFVDFCLESLGDNNVKAVITGQQIEQIRNIVKVYKNLLPDGTEKNLVHADFDPANILVTETEGEIEISGILDWEFALSGSTLCDIANMLRYSHKMPNEYENAFLKGLLSTGYQLPISWKITVNLLNAISLLDCLRRSDFENRPNQIKDIKELIDHILSNLSKIAVVPCDQYTTSKL